MFTVNLQSILEKNVEIAGVEMGKFPFLFRSSNFELFREFAAWNKRNDTTPADHLLSGN